MSIIRTQLLKMYSNAIETFGYITKANRENLNLNKEHFLDAVVIAGDGKVVSFKTDIVYIKKIVSKGDYQQTKGVRSQQRIPTCKILGFKKMIRFYIIIKNILLREEEMQVLVA